MKRLLMYLSIAMAGAALGAPAALADTSTSSNWAGYVAHRAGVHFRSVTGSWIQPRANCNTPYPTYSAIWVGLGGFSSGSNALEQIGTELDCSRSGTPQLSVWYELVPAPSQTIAMRVRAGDAMSASVTVVGHRVTLALSDHTRHASFTRTVLSRAIDTTSADWIVEAPSACLTDGSCHTLPLADFGTVHLAGATARTISGQRGAITAPAWSKTQIFLAPDGHQYVLFSAANAALARPSALSPGGSAFAVTYQPMRATKTLSANRPATRARASSSGLRQARGGLARPRSSK